MAAANSIPLDTKRPTVSQSGLSFRMTSPRHEGVGV